ncbi:MAG: ergothioneine biosynthesis protein EgtB [Bacillota bacterium]
MASDNAASAVAAAPDRAGEPTLQTLADRYREIRAASQRLCMPLVNEDYVIQSMSDVSPTKWHLAHTTWFFETLVLSKAIAGYRPFHPQFNYLFNSYYLTIGQRHCRPKRGLLSRPTVEEIYRYRQHVDDYMLTLLNQASPSALAQLAPMVEIGLHHEQQHQELILTDIKHVFSVNPLRPAYSQRQSPIATNSAPPARWVAFGEGIRWIGHAGEGFAYDNESPQHRVFLESFELASRLVTNGEYRAFMEDGGYQRGELWLSDGWNTVQNQGWEAPMYWERDNGQWRHMTLSGMRAIDDAEPVCHVSYYEADAYARWAGARLPREGEWEVASAPLPIEGNFVESGCYHPVPQYREDSSLTQVFGDVWEWTASPYVGYPGYRPPQGTLGEYNGKFMCNQFVLRGGSCATPRSHIRRTYRNFFPPEARWQFMGFRLARDA